MHRTYGIVTALLLLLVQAIANGAVTTSVNGSMVIARP